MDGKTSATMDSDVESVGYRDADRLRVAGFGSKAMSSFLDPEMACYAPEYLIVGSCSDRIALSGCGFRMLGWLCSPW